MLYLGSELETMKGLSSYTRYICTICKKLYRNERKIRSHINTSHGIYHNIEDCRKHYCVLCKKSVSSSEDKCIQHFLKSHKDLKNKCNFCSKSFLFKDSLSHHIINDHSAQFSSSTSQFKDAPGFNNEYEFHKRRTIFFKPYEEKSIPATIRLSQRQKIINECRGFIRPTPSTVAYGKFMVCLHAFFIKYDESGNFSDTKVMPMSTGYRVITMTDLDYDDALIDWISNKLEDSKDKLELSQSGWSFQYVSAIDLDFISLASVGGCQDNVVEFVEKELQNATLHSERQQTVWKKRFNELFLDYSSPTENNCFYACIATHMCIKRGLFKNVRKDEKKRFIVQSYVRTHFRRVNKNKYPAPFPLKKVKTFENDVRFKEMNLAVNVFTYVEGELWPLHISEKSKDIERVNLLLIQPDFERKDAVGHYVLLHSLDSFVNFLRGRSSKSTSVRKRNVQVCPLCFTSISREKTFESHVKACRNNNKQIVEFPKPLSEEAFIAYDYSSKKRKQAPFIGFLDFEAKMSPQDRKDNSELYSCDNCAIGGPASECKHSERVLHEQIPMTYSMYILSTSDHKIVYEHTFSSDGNVMQHFYEELEFLEEWLTAKINQYKELHWSHRLQMLYDEETICYICQSEFIEGHPQFGKVRDHCHMTPPSLVGTVLESKYLGAAHAACNLARQCERKVPIYVHNLMSYDSNFFFQASHYIPSQNVSAIPYNGNKLRCINMGCFQFLDSYQILSDSLAVLSRDLATSDCSFDILKQANLCDEKVLPLILRKSVYPYEWVRSVEQLRQCETFPSHSDFYSSIKRDTISNEDYEYGCNVFQSLGCKNMLDYTELYCKLDTLLLAEIVMSFRTLIWDFFKIPIENYISAPQITWDACLKTIDRPIEVMTNPTNVVLVEQAIRGGVSFVNNRHEKVEDLQQESILYLDATNLYGFAQQMPLPIGNYKNVAPKDACKMNWRTMKSDQPVGFILEVDLKIPNHLHDYFDDLPIAPAHDVITYEKLSPYSQNTHTIIKGYKKAVKKTDLKLTSTLEEKQRYMVHYLNLGFYLRHGAVLTNIHSCLAFSQEPYLKPYIDFLSKKRAEAKSEFKKRLFKLLANSLYGKFIQDVRKYCDVKFAFSNARLQKLCRDPFYVSHTSLGRGKNIHMVFIRKSKIKLNRLYAVGFSILELSKLHMFSLWYEELKPKFGKDISLVLTDTDSFVIKVRNHSKAQALNKIRRVMDFSNYPKENKEFYDETNKKVPGFLKDEYPTSDIMEVVAVKSKCYFLRLKASKNHIVCKGIAKGVSDTFPISLYKKCVYENDTIVKSTMTTIRAKKHKLRTVEVTKVCMTSGDDKRYQLCHLHSVPYGHKFIKTAHSNVCFKCNENMNDNIKI